MAGGRPSAANPYADHIVEASLRFGVPAAWIRAVIQVGSAGDVRAISLKGAMGLMQLMPETWVALRARHGLGRDPFDPRDNILAGAAYLREMHDRYGTPGFLAAYNAGPAGYEAFLAGRPLPTETRAYVEVLLPMVGASSGAPVSAITAVEPLAWRGAPIFVVRSERIASAVRAQPGDRAIDGARAPPERGERSMAPHSADLFVVRDGARAPR
jgi:soluble lytic murein transglycosylase-like protein